MSAQLNTVSGTIYEDIIVKMMGIQVSDLTASVIMKSTAVITGLICVALVFVVEKLNGILQVQYLKCGIVVLLKMYNSLCAIIDGNQSEQRDKWSVIVCIHIGGLFSVGKLQSKYI